MFDFLLFEFNNKFDNKIKKWDEEWDNNHPNMNLRKNPSLFRDYREFIIKKNNSIVNDINAEYCKGEEFETAINENGAFYLRLKDDHNIYISITLNY